MRLWARSPTECDRSSANTKKRFKKGIHHKKQQLTKNKEINAFFVSFVICEFCGEYFLGRYFMAEPILIAKDREEIYLLPRMSNRHGLIAGATGTGKSVTL